MPHLLHDRQAAADALLIRARSCLLLRPHHTEPPRCFAPRLPGLPPLLEPRCRERFIEHLRDWGMSVEAFEARENGLSRLGSHQ